MTVKEFAGRNIKTFTKDECVFILNAYSESFDNNGSLVVRKFPQFAAVLLQLINVMEPNLLLFHSQLCETSNPSAQPEPHQAPSPSVDSPSTS